MANVAGPMIGACIAVIIIGLVRGLPDRAEREAAEGGALPIHGAASGDGGLRADGDSDP